MKLSELSPAYEAGAQIITERIRDLSAQVRAADDPDQIQRLKRRIRELRPMQSQSRELAELTAHYYERGYARNAKYII
ncbi:MAG: hypothetical protein J5482_04050 [Oscillospiraceae bacterium]|nr:hypothetical protein [Oscillospiraceae bacterium]